MTELTSDWNGSVFGTNTGRLNLKFTQQEGALKATLRFMDDVTGVVQYELEGIRDDNGHITLDSVSVSGQEEATYGTLHIEGDLVADNTIRGTWVTSVNTGGNYILHPFVIGDTTPTTTPQQIITKRVYLGCLQIYREDIARIAEQIKRDFTIGKIIVTYVHEGTEGTIYFGDFMNMPNLRRLNYLKLAINEPDGNGFNRVVVIELRSHGPNEIMIQGSQQTWVTGQAVIMETLMKEYADAVRNMAIKFSGPLQILVFMSFVLVVTGDLSLTEKIRWASGTFIAIQVLPWLAIKLFPQAIIIMGEGKTHWLKRLSLRFGSWIVGALLVSATTVVTKYGDIILSKLEQLVGMLFSSPL